MMPPRAENAKRMLMISYDQELFFENMDPSLLLLLLLLSEEVSVCLDIRCQAKGVTLAVAGCFSVW